MLYSIKKLVFNTTLNFCLLFLLFIGLQNSSNKSKIYFLGNETVQLPVGFISGVSFICGSLIGSFLLQTINEKQ